ncbi:Defective in cullin neddylation protein [Pleurostoma richardsiae]|uniref:Defective in cullin neddylation protein n=1 Tax=Pleurostoma richardsiae TaxID=41990 RepID=A0AA38RYI1_9PEZI|nr:Defective in cullin neddylation protein [Pleurostoma richardsiae]
MPALTNLQKSLVTQFVAATGANDKTALRFLKNANFKLDVAADTYFASNPDVGGVSSAAREATLEKMFDDLRDPSADPKDSIAAESTMAYLTSLGVNMENAEMFVALELVQAPSFGEITRKGFVDGWKATRVNPSKSAHQQYIRTRIAHLSSDPVYFKKVYRHTFIACKEPEQRALTLENALVFWDMIFSPPGRPWKTASHDWLELWKQFLGEKWTRSVNRDMWNQTLEFANKSMADETLSFWSEDGAWPGVIDEFVAWFREKYPVDAMETDN